MLFLFKCVSVRIFCQNHLARKLSALACQMNHFSELQSRIELLDRSISSSETVEAELREERIALENELLLEADREKERRKEQLTLSANIVQLELAILNGQDRAAALERESQDMEKMLGGDEAAEGDGQADGQAASAMHHSLDSLTFHATYRKLLLEDIERQNGAAVEAVQAICEEGARQRRSKHLAESEAKQITAQILQLERQLDFVRNSLRADPEATAKAEAASLTAAVSEGGLRLAALQERQIFAESQLQAEEKLSQDLKTRIKAARAANRLPGPPARSASNASGGSNGKGGGGGSGSGSSSRKKADNKKKPTGPPSRYALWT